MDDDGSVVAGRNDEEELIDKLVEATGEDAWGGTFFSIAPVLDLFGVEEELAKGSVEDKGAEKEIGVEEVLWDNGLEVGKGGELRLTMDVVWDEVTIEIDGDKIGLTTGEVEDACDARELVEGVVVVELVVMDGEAADVELLVEVAEERVLVHLEVDADEAVIAAVQAPLSSPVKNEYRICHYS